MQVAHEELQDLKGVWAELSKIWEQIDELKEKPWLSVQPRKVGIQASNKFVFLLCIHVVVRRRYFFCKVLCNRSNSLTGLLFKCFR